MPQFGPNSYSLYSGIPNISQIIFSDSCKNYGGRMNFQNLFQIKREGEMDIKKQREREREREKERERKRDRFLL